jgi:hypothetical protein
VRIPFRFKNWLDWHRRDKQNTLVATAEFTTEYSDGGKKTCFSDKHILEFYISGNGIRYSRVFSTKLSEAKRHNRILISESDWTNHGDLPSFARRVDHRPRGHLVAINGGRES